MCFFVCGLTGSRATVCATSPGRAYDRRPPRYALDPGHRTLPSSLLMARLL
jgi:hypothetical protein